MHQHRCCCLFQLNGWETVSYTHLDVYKRQTERENKKLGSLYRLSGHNISKIIVGKSLLYFMVFMVFGLFFTVINFSVFDIQIRGSYWSLGIIGALFIMSIITMGFLIGSFFKTKLLAFQVLVFSSYLFFLVTGYSMPYQALPKAVQWFSDMLPTSCLLYTSRCV